MKLNKWLQSESACRSETVRMFNFTNNCSANWPLLLYLTTQRDTRMPKQEPCICSHASTHTCTHAFMRAVCERHFKDPVVFSVIVATLTGTLHQGLPVGGPEQRVIRPLKPEGQRPSPMIVSAPKTTEAISVWEKWSIPIPDVTGSAESGLSVSVTMEKKNKQTNPKQTAVSNKSATVVRSVHSLGEVGCKQVCKWN